MKDAILWIIVTALLALLFVILLFIAIIRKNKRLAVWSVLPVFLCVITATIAGYKILKRSYYAVRDAKLENPMKPRTAEEIYTALFNKAGSDCVKVLNKKDQYVPGLDCCIWLEFTTCPQELERVLAQRKYELTRTNKALLHISGDNEKPGWWKPEQMGDTVLFFRYDNPGRQLIQLISSTDSTKVFYCDMLY
ncbi:MAG: hypothetical protein QM802_16995 [Agriterribacter sp.]